MKRRTFLVLALAFLALLPAWAGPRVSLVYTTEQTEPFKTGERDARAQYRSAIEENGGVIVEFFQGEPEEETERKLAKLDAVMLPGGIDVDPQFYDEPHHEKLEKIDAELDEFEFTLLRYADEHRLPILGICRGEQVMNVHYGGSLIQDIPSQHRSEVTVKHRYPRSSPERKEHLVRLVPGTRLHALFEKDEVMVNTYHHQAVKRLGKGLIVSARAEDGVIEAIELEGDRFVVGVQFHPERMRGEHPEINRLFEAFLAAAANKLPTP